MYYYHANDIYSIVAITDIEKHVVERYAYDPYGKTFIMASDYTPRSVSICGNPWTFTARRLDNETKIMYFRSRYLDPVLGRYISRDPMGYIDGSNLYMLYGVPNAVDPLGLLKHDLSVAITYYSFRSFDDDQGRFTPVDIQLLKGECKVTEDGCDKGCSRSYRYNIKVTIGGKIELPPLERLTYTVLRHEAHHAYQYRYDIDVILEEIPGKKYKCVTNNAVQMQKTNECEKELEREFMNYWRDYVQVQWFMQQVFSYEENWHEWDQPTISHPVGGAYNHEGDPWPPGIPNPPTNFPPRPN